MTSTERESEQARRLRQGGQIVQLARSCGKSAAARPASLEGLTRGR